MSKSHIILFCLCYTMHGECLNPKGNFRESLTGDYINDETSGRSPVQPMPRNRASISWRSFSSGARTPFASPTSGFSLPPSMRPQAHVIGIGNRVTMAPRELRQMFTDMCGEARFGDAGKYICVNLPCRHERSEAIQGLHHAAPGLLRRFASRNDGRGVWSDLVILPRRLKGTGGTLGR